MASLSGISSNTFSARSVSGNLAYMDRNELDTVKSEVRPSLRALQWSWRPMRGDWEWAHALVMEGTRKAVSVVNWEGWRCRA